MGRKKEEKRQRREAADAAGKEPSAYGRSVLKRLGDAVSRPKPTESGPSAR